MIIGNTDDYSLPPTTAEEVAKALAEINQPPEYVIQRSMAYPPIEEQLDMIYWDKVNVTNEWKAMIDKVKADFPKGETI